MTLGSARFSVAAGQVRIVRVRVKPAIYRLPKRLRKVTIRVSTKATDAAGNRSSRSVVLTLRVR